MTETELEEFMAGIEDEICSLQSYLNNCHKIKSDKERLWVWENIQVCKNKINELKQKLLGGKDETIF